MTLTESWTGLSRFAAISGSRSISFVGAGGKTGLMLALARELADGGERVATTTTTKVRLDEVQESVDVVEVVEGKGAGVPVTEGEAGKVPFYHTGLREDGKLEGLPVDRVGGLLDGFDVILVEADGARGLPLKRLREHEPPLPPVPGPSAVCVVVGLDCLGGALDRRTVFNWKEVMERGMGEEGQNLDPFTVRRILFEERGYLDVIPDGARSLMMVNKVDRKQDIERGARLARALYDPRLDGIFLTSTRNGCRAVEVNNTGDRVAGMVLAAGEGTRFGAPKQLVEMEDGGAMVSKVVGTALSSDLDRVVLVLGHEHERVERGLGNLSTSSDLDIIVNEDHGSGMASSLKAGTIMAREWGADGIAVLLGDMPALTAGTIDRVLEEYRGSCCWICHPITGGGDGCETAIGHPVIIRRGLFNEVMGIEGDVGAREVVREHEDLTLRVVLSDDERPGQEDIDTVKDHEEYRSGREDDGDA